MFTIYKYLSVDYFFHDVIRAYSDTRAINTSNLDSYNLSGIENLQMLLMITINSGFSHPFIKSFQMNKKHSASKVGRFKKVNRTLHSN